nr:MAG TPA: hypothetical protein [Caudoviricetes sp.]
MRLGNAENCDGTAKRRHFIKHFVKRSERA